MKNAKEWVSKLELEPHPEGGFYKRIYASDHKIQTTSGERSVVTSIHYLLEGHDYSAWHRIKSDELWYFHGGEALTIHMLHPTGQLVSKTLNSENLMQAVPANAWFCSELAEPKETNFVLVSCVVAPGFDFEDFEMGDAEDLVSLYPQHRDMICRLCRQ